VQNKIVSKEQLGILTANRKGIPMRNYQKNLIENIAIWLLCGLLIVATVIVKRAELSDDGYEIDDWDGIAPFKIIDDAEPLDEDHRKGVYWL
jgi:hypothetical protein